MSLEGPHTSRLAISRLPSPIVTSGDGQGLRRHTLGVGEAIEGVRCIYRRVDGEGCQSNVFRVEETDRGSR